MIRMHASCVAIQNKAVLIFGESGSGKSDLALRLIDRGAVLVADDQVMLRADQNLLIASSPETIAGLIEARGIGLLKLPYLSSIPVVFAVQLVSREQVERMPEPAFFDCLGIRLPLHSLYAFDDSTVSKIRLLLLQE
ncbi:MAG: HPr kinase/phosphatase C-terminal domain-containing protein [Rickettsiales bacterium]|jgi:HPr kinase/phosphorylase|nr:HPr kinase/phosphatase C-terminal domain-containing protein [Rickettsiales bacterium]